MRKTDKYLVGVVVGVIVLVLAALVITMNQTEAEYLPDDNPEGVVNNYLLAILTEDADKAYGYLSPTLLGYPESSADFARDIDDSYSFRRKNSVNIAIDSSYIYSDGSRAEVTVAEIRFSQDTFGASSYEREVDFHLTLENGDWKIIDADSYFLWCWDREEGCY